MVTDKRETEIVSFLDKNHLKALIRGRDNIAEKKKEIITKFLSDA